MTSKLWLPPLPFDEWESTKDTLHLFLQIVGKVRLKLHPKLNHWWHAPLYVTVRGLSTRVIPYNGFAFSIDCDFIDHVFAVHTSDNRQAHIVLEGQSVAEFYAQLMSALSSLGIQVTILARPYEHRSSEPFPTDRENSAYDREYIERYWRILLQVESVLKEFAGRFVGKASPIHLFWHSFDLAYTRFSGRRVPELKGANPVEREAYSHEVVSFGFWPGDPEYREPAFYSYTYPEPAGLSERPLDPAGAFWTPRNESHLAVLPYEGVRRADAPRQAILDFYESTYSAGADLAGWSRSELEVP